MSLQDAYKHENGDLKHALVVQREGLQKNKVAFLAGRPPYKKLDSGQLYT